MLAPWPILQQVLASRRSEDDAIFLGAAAVAFVGAIACVVFGVRFVRRKQLGLAVLLFLLGGLALALCLGSTALVALSKLAWH